MPDPLQDRSMFEALHATCRAMQTRLVELIDQVLVLVIVMVMVAMVLLRVLVVVMGADAAGHSDEAMHLLSPVAGAQVQDDSLTADLLEVNDDMNNLFLRCQHSTEVPSPCAPPGTTGMRRTRARARPGRGPSRSPLLLHRFDI